MLSPPQSIAMSSAFNFFRFERRNLDIMCRFDDQFLKLVLLQFSYNARKCVGVFSHFGTGLLSVKVSFLET